MNEEHWIKQLSYVRNLTGLKAALDSSGRRHNDAMAIRLERMLRFCNTTRFSMLDETWDVVDIVNLRGLYATPPLMSVDLVVELRKDDGSTMTDWGWNFLTLLRRPLNYTSVVYSTAMRFASQREEITAVTYAFDAFELLLPTATAPCWPMFHIEQMEFGFTFVNEQDAITFEALRLAFPVEFPSV